MDNLRVVLSIANTEVELFVQSGQNLQFLVNSIAVQMFWHAVQIIIDSGKLRLQMETDFCTECQNIGREEKSPTFFLMMWVLYHVRLQPGLFDQKSWKNIYNDPGKSTN